MYYADINPEVSETCQIECSFKRSTLCDSIASISPQTVFDIKQKVKMHGIKGEFQFHSHGQDQDCKKRNGTLTAMFRFPKKPHRVNVVNYEDCDFKLSVKVYEGPIRNKQILGQSTSIRRLDDDDRKRGALHMTVHGVVSLEKIIFTKSDTPPDQIFMEVKVDLNAKGHTDQPKKK